MSRKVCQTAERSSTSGPAIPEASAYRMYIYIAFDRELLAEGTRQYFLIVALDWTKGLVIGPSI